MSAGRGSATAAAIVFGGVDLVLSAAAIVLVVLPLRAGVANPYPAPPLLAMIGLFLLFTPILGALVAARQPRNPAGWLFLAMALFLAVGAGSDSVARHVPASPGVGLFVSFGSGAGSVWTIALTLLLALFPNGRLPGRRWTIVPGLAIVASVMQIAAGLVDPGGGISPPIAGLTYPLARPDWAKALAGINEIAQLLTTLGVAGFLPLFAVRFRGARGTERQQLKWFLWAAAVIASILVFCLAVNQVNGDWGNAAWALFQGSLLLLPVAATAAILRYRLFDIDLVIRRTLVYGALSAILAVVYAASVLLIGQLVSPLSGSGSFAVAASTLLVAALFQPIRRRVQTLVDGRFYRSRYDAARELSHLGAGLRNELDVRHVEALLTAAVERTIQPASASIWLRSAAARSAGEPR